MVSPTNFVAAFAVCVTFSSAAAAVETSEGPQPLKGVSTLVRVAQADAPSRTRLRIQRGQKAIEGLEFEVAAEELMIATTTEGATEEELIEANLYAGIANRVLNRDVESRLNFRFVLQRDPSATLPPGMSPKIISFFELVRQEVHPTTGAAPDEVIPATAAETAAGDASLPLLSGLSAVGLGAVVGLAGLAGLVAAEALLADPLSDGELKRAAGAGFYVGLGAAGVGFVVALVGGGLAAFALVQE